MVWPRQAGGAIVVLLQFLTRKKGIDMGYGASFSSLKLFLD